MSVKNGTVWKRVRGRIDCEQSLLFFRFSESNARARERRGRETRETRAVAREERRKPLLFKQTLKSRFTCLACQHFSFDAKKSLDRERPFSLALRVVSLFSCLSRLALLVTRVAICVSHVLLDGLQKKGRLLVVYGSDLKVEPPRIKLC